MSRRAIRGRGGSAAVSFFSFQDIMMSVMGILILVTLMMALELSEASSQAPARTETAITDELAAAVASSEAEIAQLERDYAEVMAGLERLQAWAGGGETRIAELMAEAEQRRARYDALLRMVDERRPQLASKQAELAAANEANAQAEVVEQRAAALREELAKAGRTSRMRYILQEQTQLKPLLLMVAGDRVGLGSPDEEAAAVWFRQPSLDAQDASVRDALGEHKPTEAFVVILLKPSGFDRLETFEDIVRERRFGLGLDLLPEDASVLPEPQP